MKISQPLTTLATLVIMAFLPTRDILAAEVYPTMTVLTSKFEITNRTIESAPTFSMTGATLQSQRDIGDGVYLIEDDFSPAQFSRLGDYKYYKLGLKLRDSRVNVRMVGQKLGHSFDVKGRYLSAKMTASGIILYISGGHTRLNEPSKNGGDCNATLIAHKLNKVIEIKANSNDVSKFCRHTTTGVFFYTAANTTSPRSLLPNHRQILLDIGGLQKNSDYRKAPPDIYTGTATSDNTSGFSVERWEVPDSYSMPYQNNITIQKNPYFESITLPMDENVFDVKTVGEQIKGNLTIPYVMNGQFTPYNTITLSVTSANNFNLKDEKNRQIPYSLSTTIGVRKLAIAEKGTAKSGSTSTLILTDLSKEFYALQGRFDADFSVEQSKTIPGNYTDTVTAVYKISL